MKKLLAIITTIAMILSLSVPAFAVEITSTQTGSNTATKSVTANYTPTATITGVSITVDGTPYTTGNVTITPTSTVTLTVTGTNLQNGTDDNRVDYAHGSGESVTSSWFTVTDDGTTATRSLPASDFANSSNYEIGYYNNYTAGAGNYTRNSTGIFVTYDLGISEEEKAVITGVSINVDGQDYTSGNVTVYSGSTVTLTVTGTNLQNSTGDNCVAYALYGHASLAGNSFEISGGGTTATYAPSFSYFIGSSNYEIKYYNDYNTNATAVGTGIYVTYNEGTKPTEPTTAAITGVTISGVETNDEGAYVINPNSTVTVTVSGTDFDKLDENNQVNVNGTAEALTTDNGWTIDTTANTATKQYVGTAFETVSAIKYTNNGTDWTDAGITISYEIPKTISVSIDWGDMSFTYSDDTKAWTANTTDGDKVTVTNNGTVTVGATVTYTSDTNHSGITGSFSPASANLDANAEQAFTLTLSGAPTAALEDVTIGNVTVTITEPIETVSLNFSFENTSSMTYTKSYIKFYDSNDTLIGSSDVTTSATSTVSVPSNASTFQILVDYSETLSGIPMDHNWEYRASSKIAVPTEDSDVAVVLPVDYTITPTGTGGFEGEEVPVT